MRYLPLLIQMDGVDTISRARMNIPWPNLTAGPLLQMVASSNLLDLENSKIAKFRLKVMSPLE